MVSKAIASLDPGWPAPKRSWPSSGSTPSPRPWGCWRARARRNGRSPSPRSPRDWRDLLGSLCARPGRWILIVEPVDQPYLFWQALAFEDGSLVPRSCRTTTSPRSTIGHDSGGATPRVGLGMAVRPYLTNRINVQATTAPDIGSVASQALATFRELFGLEDEGPVFVKLFSSALRGDTPAGSLWPCASGDVELIEPFGGPDEEDPELHPDPTADAPPFGDEPEEDDDDDEE